VRAAVNTRYGPPEVLAIREVPKPEPVAGEVRVRVHATTVTRTDCGMLLADPFIVRFFMGLSRPRRTILGMDFAGEVDAVGAGVTAFAPGDRVFGMSPAEYGAHAEYLCVAAAGAIAHMPAGMRFDECVVCEGASYAQMYLDAFGLAAGDAILVYGASGAIGTAAVQLAKAAGARVVAVVSMRHLDLAASLGADRVVDYTAGDFTAIDETFDSVFDAVGKTTYFRCRKLLKPGGTYAGTDFGPWLQNPLLAVWSKLTGRRRVVFPTPDDDDATIAPFLRARMEAGGFRAVVDRRYPLERIADAYRYVMTRKKTGIVVIDVTGEGGSSRA
jgi:NADPH:quinone reductase-like Zn-dependent oxidoreductase